MNTSKLISCRQLSITILACLLCVIIANAAHAQNITDGSTPLAVSSGAPTGSYPLGNFDSVNLYNGSLNFRLPLVAIAGRGEASYRMVLKIETKWVVEKEAGLGQPNKYTPTTAWWGLDGLQPIYSVGKLQMRLGGSREFVISGNCGYIHSETLTRLTFTTPDGTEYELRDQQTNGRPDHPTCATGGFNRGRVFITSDGSSATFISDADISDYIYGEPSDAQPSGYLVLRDGMKFRIEGGQVKWMRDRNGNKVIFGYNGLALATITDSLNRQVTITYADQNTPYDQITEKGFGGAPRITKVYRGSALRSDFTVQTFHQLFPSLNGAFDTPAPPSGVTAVELPNGQQYQFYYDSYSELARVVVPTGGAIEYDYAPGLTDSTTGGVLTWTGDKQVYRRVVERRVYPNGGTGAAYASRTTYSRPESSTLNNGYVVTDQYDPGGTLFGRSYHYFYGSAKASFGQQPTQYPGWKDGREYQTTVYALDGTTPLRQVNNSFAQRAPVGWWTGSADMEPPNDPRVVETVTTLMDTNQVAKQTSLNPYDNNDKGFDQFNNKTDTWEYDYGVGAPGTLIRHSHTDFLSTADYTDAITGPSLLSLPSRLSVYDANGNELARTTFEYDNYNGDSNHGWLTNRTDISGFDPSFSTSYTRRGNATSTSQYLLIGSGVVTGSITAYLQYDIAGNPVKAIDVRGHTTTFDYSDRFGGPDGEARSNSSPTELSSQGQSSYAFPTAVTNPLGQTAYTQSDYYLSQTVDTEDVNGIVSSTYYNDPLNRPKLMIRAVNGGIDVKSQTTFNYDDIGHVVTTTTDQNNYLDNLLKTEMIYDGLGRTTEKRQYESATGYIALKQSYDALGRSSQTSNPFRLGETILWTTNAYDDLGRVKSITSPDGAVVKTAYSGNRVLVADQNQTDQLRRKRISRTDALGRVKDLWEVTSTDGATEAISFPGWPDVAAGYHTVYDYDTLNNLTSVTQGNQTRSFVYDSLKRLTSTNNPESGTVYYQYDEGGNLRVRTDARSVSAHFSYDALNRMTRRWYNSSMSLTEQANNSPALPNDVSTSDEVTYFYDSQGLPSGAPSFPRGYATGRLVAITYGTGSSGGAYYGYDGAGRGVLKIQQTAGSNYQVTATYNLAGAIASETYPSGHIVSYGYDSAGRANAMTGRLGDGRSRTYATGISYSPFGGIAQEQFGTQTSLYHKLHYNLRGQLFDIRVSSLSLAANEWDWNRGALVSYYSSNFSWGGNSTGSGLDNNGNVTRQQHWVPTNDPNNYTYTQDDYNYDSLNRLSSTNEIHGGPNSQSGQDYVQSYDYDRWGNRTINPGSSSAINHTQFDKSDAQNSNRLYAPGDISLPMGQRKMQYDSAGNLTHDSYTGDNRTRSYDAENRLSLLALPPIPPVCYPDGEGGLTCYPVDPGPSQAPIQYVYDGDGHRVRRFIHDQETRQVYGLGGELLAEYAASTSPTTLQKEYGYRNGQLLITAAPGYGSSGSLRPDSSSGTSASSVDLLARVNKVELPSWIRDLFSTKTSAEAISDTSTPLYGPRFPYASLNSGGVLPVMPQSGITKIAFASNREGIAQLYSMNTDGSGALRLTNDAANDESPRWSPNGSRIVFQSDRDNVFSGMADIYVMNADGSGQTRLTSDANDDSAPVWSPNGSKIAFQSARSGVSYQVYVMNADGSSQANISNNTANDKQPSWSPDGTKIAFASDRDQAGFSSIYVMNSNGTNQTRLTFSGSGFRDEQPAWSPDGTRLAFTSTRDSSVVTWTETDDDGNTLTKTAVVTNKEVYVMNADGNNQVRLTNTLENDDSPTWSSDGTQIAFRSDRERDCCDPTNQVWVMNTNGGNPVDLSNNGFGDYSPNWSNIMAPPPPPNGAQFISQSVPQTMTAGQSYSVSVTVKNTGSNTWTSASNYNLGSQNAQDNTTWGLGRVGLPYSVASGSQATFNFTVTAPASSGTYNFQWRMVQDGVEWFGDFSANVAVTVSAQPGGNPNPEPDPSTPIADVRWIVADQLGTPRMIFDQSGSLANVSLHDYLPFGEELVGIGVRSTTPGYNGNDAVRQKFDQKEWDYETGLEYFGARYFANVQGRFISVDPALTSADLSTPQSWNRYAFGFNNPLRYVDPTGAYIWSAELGGSDSDADLLRKAGTDDKKRREANKIIEQRNRFRDALKAGYAAGCDSDEPQTVWDALNAYGSEGVDNGVTVTFGKTANGTAAEASAVSNNSLSFDANGKATANVLVTINSSITDMNQLVQAVGHEGSHVEDRQSFASYLTRQIKAAGGMGNFDATAQAQAMASSHNRTVQTTELNAYIVSGLIAQGRDALGHNFPNSNFNGHAVWDNRWSAAERPGLRAIGAFEHVTTSSTYANKLTQRQFQ
jgi:RHS repeat-associated protein